MSQGVNILPEEFVREQLKSVLSDMHPDVVSSSEQRWFENELYS